MHLRYTLVFIIAPFLLLLPSYADERLSGGSTTVFVKNNKAFARPLANITKMTRRHHVVGNSFFNKNWVEAPASTASRDGLGPLFNARSCSACHLQDGRGAPPVGDEPTLGLLIRLSLPAKDSVGQPVSEPVYGRQASTRALPGVQPEGRVKITYEEIPGVYADGEKFSLRKPSYEIVELSSGPLNKLTRMSPRVAPAVHGLGLLEAISDDTILAHADPEDEDNDGISGKANWVWDFEKEQKLLGRFGWKANQPHLRQQTAAAFNGDIGITSSIFPQENYTQTLNKKYQYSRFPSGGSPELSDKILSRVTTYLQSLAPPARRRVGDAQVLRGQALFSKMQCASCHVAEYKTAKHVPLLELANQTIRPYTDLLLHDMGPALADNREDFDATGSEWRTPPLWGIGLQETVNRHTFFLHDGRARNLSEAILWHGGEAERSKEYFRNSSKSDRGDLLAFLESL